MEKSGGFSRLFFVVPKTRDFRLALLVFYGRIWHFAANCVLRTLGLSPQMPVLQSHKHSDEAGLGFITMTPNRQRLQFRFTIFSGAVNTEDMIFFLTEIHRYYGGNAAMRCKSAVMLFGISSMHPLYHTLPEGAS